MSNTRILLVEDEISVAESIQFSLTSLGYTVPAIASSREEALQQVAEIFPDLVLMDIHLEEEMDGIEAADQIHARFDVPIVYLTGYDDEKTLQQAKATEPFGYLLKPFNIRELHTTIEIALYKHETDKKLQARETRFRSIIQDQTELIWRYLPDGTLTFVNEACRWYFGQEPTELVGQCFFRFIPEEEQQRVRNLIASLRVSNPVVEMEHRIILSERTIRWHHWTNRIICDDQGTIIEYQGTGRDLTERKQIEEELHLYRERLEELVEERTTELIKINERLQREITERKRAEQALQTSEQQYRLLAESVADGIAIVQEGKLEFVNKALCSILDYTSNQLLQINPVNLLRDDYKESGRKELKLVEKGGGDQVWQAPCVTRNGREIWVETHRGVIEWEEKPAILVTVRDITERKLRDIEIEEEKKCLKHINIALRSTIKDRYKFGDIVGKSPVMQDIYEFIIKASAAAVNVVISGESGTGKELIARTIHQMSRRHEKAFVPVNCGAIPDMLFEREFFGHQKGAFTGAYANKPGYFDLANQGTLFLDEVSEIPLHIQVKLLRALEDGEYIPVGSNTAQKADVRIIAATNKNLENLIQQGLIREDIFYRIHVLGITAPPLRDRREDIPLLIDHFLTHFGYDKTQHVLPGDVLEKLYTYHWPGNIRELQNVLRRYLTIGRLDFRSAHKTEPDKKDDGVEEELSQESPRLREAVEDFEKRFIINTLKRHHWHKGKAAMALDIPRRTFHRKLKKFGIK